MVTLTCSSQELENLACSAAVSINLGDFYAFSVLLHSLLKM